MSDLIMWVLLIFLLFLSAHSEVQKCSWREATDNVASLSYLLKYPDSGTCHYSINRINASGINNPQLLLFINDLKINNSPQLVLNCAVHKNQTFGKCSSPYISSFLLNQKKQNKFNISLKLLKINENQVSNSIELKFWKYVQFDQKKQEFQEELQFITINNINIQGLQEIQKIYPSKFIQILISIVQYLTIPTMFYIFFTKNNIIQAYSFLQQILLLQIIQISIRKISGKFSQLNEMDISSTSMWIMWGILILNFVYIMLGFKYLLKFIENGSAQFYTPSSPTTEQAYIGSFLSSENNLNDQSVKIEKKLINSVLSYLYKLMHWYKNQNVCIRRIQWLLLIIFWKVLASYCYEIVGIVLQTLFFVILPVYIYLKSISCTSQINNDLFSLQKPQKVIPRDAYLFPLAKINFYFLIKFYAFSFQYDFGNPSLRMNFQIAFISILWFMTVKFIRFYVNNKIGKKVKIYERTTQNRLLQKIYKSSILQFLCKKYDKETSGLQQEMQDINCCICLESISGQNKNDNENYIRNCVQTQCGHIFHVKCFSQWTRNKMICPVDRNNLNRQVVKKIIDQIEINE